jgi:hypothetical protein
MAVAYIIKLVIKMTNNPEIKLDFSDKRQTGHSPTVIKPRLIWFVKMLEAGKA